MALIHVFNGIEKKTTYTFNGRIKDFIENIDFNNSIILKGGERITPDYNVEENDTIYIRHLPTAATSLGIGAIAAIIVGGTALLTAGIYGGVKLYKLTENLEKLQEDAEKAAKAATQTEKLPYVRGARNQPATGRGFPYAIGESLMTPYRLCPAHYTLDGDIGEKQYYNAVLEVAYNDILIKKIKLGETTIKQFSEETPQNGIYQWDAGTYYDESNVIEIRQNGDFITEDFNKKIVLNEINTEIPHQHVAIGTSIADRQKIEKEWKDGIVQQCAPYAQKVEVIVLLDGLQQLNDNGELQKSKIELQVQWTNNPDAENPTWHDFTRGFKQKINYSNTFEYLSKKQMRFIATQEFTAAQSYGKKISIRVIRKTPRAASNARDTIYLMGVQTYCYDNKKSNSNELIAAKVLEDRERDKCCRIGVRIAANNNTDGFLDAISVIESGCARTWNGTEWSTDKTPTRNLAAWVLEILTSPHHIPSQYDDDELDLESFGQWYEYCAQEGYNADGIVTEGAPKRELIETLCQNGNATLVYSPFSGKIEVAIDNGRDYSIALLNSDNIVNISTNKTFKRKTDGRKVKYINRAADYEVDNVIFMGNGETYDPAIHTLSEIALKYVTDHDHAFKIAWRQNAEEKAQPRVITLQTSPDAAYYPLYSRVELQHRTLKNGIANATIKNIQFANNLLNKIILNNPVTFPAGVNCGVIINCVSNRGHGVLPVKVTGSGTTDELQVISVIGIDAPLLPSAGNSLSFGELDENGEFKLVTSSMKIVDVEENGQTYNLTLVDYNPALYNYGDIPEYKSNISPAPNNRIVTIEQQREYVTLGESQATASEAAQAAVDTVIKGARFTNIYKIRPVENSLEDIIAKMDADARNASASISMSADEILLQVADMERGLVGLLDVQAGAVTALVEGGGTSGQMSLSLNLPVMITEETRLQLVTASSAETVNAVYTRIDGTDFYGIDPAATQTEIKTLWDAAVNARLLASQIELQADQIYIDGDVIVNENRKIKAAIIEVDEITAGLVKTTDIQSGSGTFTGLKADSAEFTNVKMTGEVDITRGISVRKIANLNSSESPSELYNKINNIEHNNKTYMAIGEIGIKTSNATYILNVYNIEFTDTYINIELSKNGQYKKLRLTPTSAKLIDYNPAPEENVTLIENYYILV